MVERKAPVAAQMSPYEFRVEEGKKYFWCACGLSAVQPLCDGAHSGTGIAPKMWQASENKTVWLCGCKRTGTPPFCDGSHSK